MVSHLMCLNLDIFPETAITVAIPINEIIIPIPVSFLKIPHDKQTSKVANKKIIRLVGMRFNLIMCSF